MAGDNPTLAAANEATGTEPLNSQPSEPQPPKEQSTGAEVPAALNSLPSALEPVVFPLDLGSRTKNNQTVSSLPSASEFEDLVKATIRPPGPSRAEEVDIESWKAQLGAQYADVVDKVSSVVESRHVKVYKVDTGVGKAEYYVVGLDVDGERIVGVRAIGLEG